MSSEAELKAVWRMLSDAYPNNKNQPGTAAVYAMALADLPDDVLRAAALECVTTCKFFPTVAEIRAAASTVSVGGHQRHALEAWADVKAAVTRYGRRWTPTFDDPLVSDCVRALGWVDFCNSEIDEEMSWRARFCDIYEAMSRRQQTDFVRLPEVRVQAARQLETSTAMRKLAAQLSAPKERND